MSAFWEQDDVLVSGPKTASGIKEAWQAGYQSSLAGLIDRNKLPDVVLDPHHNTWYERAIGTVSQLVNEGPEMIGGAIAGGAAGGVVTANPIGAVLGGGAGAFAVPTAIRAAYMHALKTGQITSSSDFLDRTKMAIKALGNPDVLLETGKAGVVGGATMGVGKYVEPLVAGAMASRVAAGSMAPGAARVATDVAKLGAEGATMVVTPAALEGRMPEPQEFLDAAILLGGLKAATSIAPKLIRTYEETGKTPVEVVAEARQDPVLMKELLEPAVVAPTMEIYRGLKQKYDPNTKRPTYFFSTERSVAESYSSPTGEVLTARVPVEAVLDVTKTAHVERLKPEMVKILQNAGWGENAEAQAAKILRKLDESKGNNWHLMENPEVQVAARNAGFEGMIVKEDGVRNVGMFRDPVAEAATIKPLESAARPDTLPKTYEALAAETRAREAVPPESIEAAAAFAERPFAKIPQAPGEPVLKTHVNYNYLDTPDATKMALSRLSEMYEAKIREKTRETVTWEQTYAEAKKLYEDVTGQDAPRPVAGADYAKLSADLYARRQLLTSGAEQLMVMRDNYAKAKENGTATDTMKLELAAQMERVGMAMAETRGAQAEVGRALNVLKSTNRDKAYYDQLNDILSGRFRVDGKEVGGAKFDTMIDMLGDMGSPKQALQFAEQASKATTWQKVVEAWKSGLVSGPITQLANIIGNVTFAATRPVVDTVAVAFNKATSAKEQMSAVEPLARVMGNVNGVIDGAKMAFAVLRTGESPILNEVQRPKAIEGKLGEAVRTPFRLLGAADAFFRVVSERGEAYSLATRQAAKEGLNPATHEFRERVAYVVNNLSESQLKQVEEAGLRFTFNMPLGEAGRSIKNTVRATHSEWMVPFVQTPANVLKEMIRLTPAAPIIAEWRADLAAGGVRASKAAAEIAVGTAVSVTFFSLARAGLITGQGDPDPRKRAAQMASGWQPYSVKIGDTWYSYQRLQPVGTLIGMAADSASVWDNMTEEEGDKAAKITATAFANAITNQTFLQGITNVINATSDPDRYGAKFAQNLTASAVPGIIGQTNQLIDPYKREVDSVLEAVQSRLPVASQDLRPKRDIFGEPIANTDRVGGLLPIAESKETTDKVRQEVARLKEGVGKAPKYIELPAGRDPKLGRLNLNGQQQDVFAKEAGQFAYKQLREIITDPSWDTLSDMEQRGVIKRVFEVTRKVGRYSAVSDQQLEEKIQQIETELNKRMQPK